MEEYKYKSVTPIKKKHRKITSTAALLLCILCFIVGIVIGKANTSDKETKAAAERINLIEKKYQQETSRWKTEKEAYDDEINRLKIKLAEVSNDSKSENTDNDKEEELDEDDVSDSEQKTEDSSTNEAQPEEQTNSSGKAKTGGILRKLILGCLIVIIVACILFALSIIFKKDDEFDENEEDEDDDESDYDDYSEEDDE